MNNAAPPSVSPDMLKALRAVWFVFVVGGMVTLIGVDLARGGSPAHKCFCPLPGISALLFEGYAAAPADCVPRCDDLSRRIVTP